MLYSPCTISITGRDKNMDAFVIALVLVAVWGIKINKISAPIDKDYFSVENCTAVKGILALSIVFSHLTIATDGGRLMPLFAYVGYLGVALFFFISGYGMMKKTASDEHYLEGFALKRVNKIVIPYAVVICIYWLASLMTNEPYSAKEVALSMVNGYPIAENSWYIIVCLLMYAVFWLAAKVSKTKPAIIVLCEVIFCALWIPLAKRLDYGQWWYVSNFALPVGMLWAMYEDRILKLMSDMKKYIATVIFAFLLVAISFALTYFGNAWIYYAVSSTVFVIAFAFVCMKLRFGNPALRFLGKISMEIYFIHGLFITMFRSGAINVENDVAYSALVIVCSVISAVILNALFKRLRIKSKSSMRT